MKAKHTNKDNCDLKSAEKNVHILYDFMKDKIAQSRICPVDTFKPR